VISDEVGGRRTIECAFHSPAIAIVNEGRVVEGRGRRRLGGCRGSSGTARCVGRVVE
jgi:hypothetical protein